MDVLYFTGQTAIRKEKKIDHEGGFQGALLQSTTKEGKFKADQVERGSV